MFRVLTCLSDQHDWWLVVLASLVCFLTSVVAIGLLHRAYVTKGPARCAWMGTSGVAIGCGIWATHFIGMLAYDANVPVGYEIPTTIMSLVVAIVLTCSGLAVANQGRSILWAAVGGAVVGIGIAAMHYLGMFALTVQGTPVWSPGLVIASIAAGVILAVASLVVAASRKSGSAPFAAAVLLTLAIVSHHFTAMGAVEFIPDPSRTISPNTFSPQILAIVVAFSAILVLGLGALGTAIDRRLRDQGLQLRTAMNNMRQALLMFDADRRLIISNRQYAEMYRLQPQSVVPGRTLRELLQLRIEAGTFTGDPDQYLANIFPVVANDSVLAELPDGRTISMTMQAMEDGGWVATHEDITDRKNAEAKIAYMAHHDALTNLPNRTAFGERLEKSLGRARRGRQFAIHCLDLDRFKYVNDTLGHPIGDALLQSVADRLRGCLRETDAVARLGGDEFVVLQDEIERPADAATLAQRLIDAVSQPYDLDGNHVIVGVSIGIAICPPDGTDGDQLMRNGDMALYRAKNDGRGVYRFFESRMDEQLRARRLLELDLRQALSKHEFALYYQPLVDAQTNEITGCEALIRWCHPDRGLVSPADFIPLAEETGLIEQIGEWVLREACKEAASWPQNITLAVNLSPVQFKSRNLVEMIASAIAEAGLSGSRLELEITESVLLLENETTLAVLHRLRDFGIRIAMDDFGTGYSSLGYLRSFPFNKIKIDRSFIKDLASNRDCAAIVKAVAGIGLGLGITTTAEGVETKAQLDRVRAEGCTQVQGFLFGAPCPGPEIRQLIRDWPRARIAA